MPTSHRIDSTARINFIKCTTPSGLDDLERAMTILLQESTFDASSGVLLELGRDTVLLSPTQACAVAELFAAQRERLRGPIAVWATGLEYSTGRLIAIFGRHRGLHIEAFPDRRAALAWLTDHGAPPFTHS